MMFMNPLHSCRIGTVPIQFRLELAAHMNTFWKPVATVLPGRTLDSLGGEPTNARRKRNIAQEAWPVPPDLILSRK